MWSEYSLEVVDAVARNGSFSAAAQELHRVPSAVSYTVRQLEEWLAVPLFERRHRDVELTAAGAWFLKEGRSVVKKMQITRQQCQQIANGWRGQLAIAVDNIVRPERTRQMIVDFYRHFDDVELLVFQEVFNGVWDALSDGRVELAIGATRAIPVGGRYAFRDMGMLSWSWPCQTTCRIREGVFQFKCYPLPLIKPRFGEMCWHHPYAYALQWTAVLHVC